jgi:hypothetical protein
VNEPRTPLAFSIAALFLAASQAACRDKPSSPSMPAELPKQTGDSVQCLGIHESKGKSACHVAGGHACAGQNECKGKGWISVPRAECAARGGKVLES